MQVAVSGGNDSTARLWSTDTGAALAELPARGEVFVARFHPHRNLVATQQDTMPRFDFGKYQPAR